MKTRQKLETLKKQKNITVTILVAGILWLAIAVIVYFVSPDTFAIIPIFFFLLFSALVFTVSAISKSTRQGLIISLGIILFLVLRYFGVGHILNLILIAGIIVAVEIFHSSR